MTRLFPTETRLLIADDDPGFRETVAMLLEPHVDTIVVESGEQAIAVVTSHAVDLALFDMHMPLLTGLEAFRVAREIRAELPGILMTADLTDELEREAQAADLYTVLRKPPTRDLLLDTIAGALQAS